MKATGCGERKYNEISLMLDYVRVYQISNGTSGPPFALVGLASLALALILILGKWRLHWRRPSWLFAGFSLAFGIMWMFLARAVLIAGSDAFTASQTGRYSVVEGMVDDFHPMSYEGHDDECFTVGSQRFCYSDYEVTPGFRNAASHGGPIRDGIHVRVAYFGGTILRLEIPRNEILSSAELASRAQSAERQYAIRTDNDAFLQRMETSFFFTMVVWFFWWNLQWRQAMRFWVKPPNTQFVVYLFRIFFALCLIGSLKSFVERVQRHPITGENVQGLLLTTVIVFGVVASMTAFSIWFARQRERQMSHNPRL